MKVVVVALFLIIFCIGIDYTYGKGRKALSLDICGRVSDVISESVFFMSVFI